MSNPKSSATDFGMYAPNFSTGKPSYHGMERRENKQLPADYVLSQTTSQNEPLEIFDTPLNIFQVPGFAPHKITEAMERDLEGEGGYLDQNFLYWDHQNAKNWCQLTEHKEYLSQYGFPYEQVSKSILNHFQNLLKLEKKRIEVLAFGPGNGKKELHLVKILSESFLNFEHILVNLLDVSQPLLAEWLNLAQALFLGDPRIKTWGIQGNMYHLPQYYPFRFLKMKPRPRLITLIGTLCNLPNEALFIQNISKALRSGDLLLVEVTSTYAPSDQPQTIFSKDPRLNGTLPKAWNHCIDNLLISPFERHYNRRLQNISLKSHLDHSNHCISGSYAVTIEAEVVLKNHQTKEFIVQRFVRYEPNALIHMFDQLGWETVDTWRFGKHKDYLLFLFQKR